MTEQLYNVGDRVRASHVGSMILEAAVVEEIVEEHIGRSTTTTEGVEQEGPLYWTRFEIGGMCVYRWQNELVPQPELELTT